MSAKNKPESDVVDVSAEDVRDFFLDEERLLPERVVELQETGHPVDVVDRHLVVNDKPDDDSTGYLVAEIETTPVPDESATPITLFVCHCSHAHYRVFNWSRVDGPAGADPGDDKHVHRVLWSEKRERQVDDDQVTLADGGTVATNPRSGGRGHRRARP